MRVRSLHPAWLVLILVAILVVTASGVALSALPVSRSSAPLSMSATSSSSGSVVVGAFTQETPISPAFWGINIAAAQRFNSVDAASVAAMPVSYLVFPAGNLGEEYNYTSGVVTQVDGSQSLSQVSAQEFVTNCESFKCKAIMQLPTEIDRPATAAVYAAYVVHTLGYQPAYWQLGNDPGGWSHYKVPWANWKADSDGNTTPVQFATEVQAYIGTVLTVDPSAKFLALGMGMGGKDYAKPWVEQLASVDGHLLSGIALHSYALGGSPSAPTDDELLANLNGVYSIPAQVTADRQYIKDACSSCTKLSIFITEANAAEDSSLTKLLPTFVGTLYLAVDTVQGLASQVTNLDWFAYDSGYSGSWSQHPQKWQMQYYLFSDIMTHLENETLPTTVTGPSSFYGMATYDKSGEALLLVNVNTTTQVSASLSKAGFIIGRAGVTEYSWVDGSEQPTKSSITLSSTLKIPALSIILLTVGGAGTQSPDATGFALAPLVGGALTSSVVRVGSLGLTVAVSSMGAGIPLFVLGVLPFSRKGRAEFGGRRRAVGSRPSSGPVDETARHMRGPDRGRSRSP